MNPSLNMNMNMPTKLFESNQTDTRWAPHPTLRLKHDSCSE